MSRISNIFGSLARPSAKAPSTNRDGYPAFERPLEEQYLQTLLTNTFGNTFYVSQKELIAEAALLHDQMVARDPAFAASALVHARNRGFMRAQPVFGLAKLASVKEPHLEAAFGEVVLTPNDLADFTTVVKLLRSSEGGRRLKRLAGRWLVERLNEYWVIKYGASRDGGYSLRDLFRVYHPKTGERLPLVDYLLGRAADLSKLPQIAALERLKKAVSDEDRVAAIDQGRLPHEVVTPFARSRAVWAALVPQLPVFALLRHLATLERQGVVEIARRVVEGKLLNPKVIGSSKILPFRFVEAERHVKTSWLKDALRDALDLSFANVPAMEGSTVVMLDRSSSMGRYVQTAAIFAVSLLKKSEGRLLLFDDKLEELVVSQSGSVLTQAQKVKARGDTNTALPIQQLLHERQSVDNIVLITDEQQNLGSPFVDVLAEYRRKVKADVRAFILDVAPYRNALTGQDPNVWYIYGWSEQALSFISMASRGFGSMAEAIRNGIH
jgi:60 kDa SS-A/Ro ribonucleoprotein